MDRSHYLHVHLPGRGRLTLSLPSGVERAIVSGRLTTDAQVWYEQINLWVSISRHPEMAKLLKLVQLPTSSLPRRVSDPPELFDLEVPPKVASKPAVESHDPAQLPLIALEEVDEFREFHEFLRRSGETEERRIAARTSGPIQTRPAKVLVAGALDPVRKAGERLWRWVPKEFVPRWAASIALTLLGSMAVGLFFLMRSPGDMGTRAPVTVTNALSAFGQGVDSAADMALGAPNPLANEERELESNLRIAEAVVWQPAIDFSPEFIWRSARKVGAVQNSISLYRIGAWRQLDSASRDNDPRLEPYEEAVRVDEVLSLVESAVSLLDSLIAAFHVNGEMLVFSDPGQAARYSWLRNRADSLLHIPVLEDSTPLTRAPRRVVTRLLETLPAAVVTTP